MSTSESSGPDSASGDVDTDLGNRLRTARESMDLSIDDVSAELRITVEALTALEDSRFSEIGAQVFAKGYLKQYAARLGLNVNELAAEFDRAAGLESVVVEPSRTISLGSNRNLMFWVLGAAALAIVIALAWFGWQLWGSLELTTSEPAANVTEPSAAARADAELPVDPVVEPAASFAEPLPVARSEPEPLINSVAESGAPAGTSSPGVSIEAPPENEAELADQAASEPLPVTESPMMVVSFLEDSWAEITSASGERLYFDMGQAGSQTSIPAGSGTSFLFGNGGGVAISLDGEALAIPGSPESGDVASFSYDELTD